ncbi:sensor histidine kinase [Inhella proteolytica]|uniref:Histidine kinase n=1 Tax=Inhella proteolytica TaxID=2795029 RepID=A0A931NHL8_9BURK|nr:histidine kinase [Inhella proteolytica]MBH9578371.1 histidine kinase [Inhella proteolytica]
MTQSSPPTPLSEGNRLQRAYHRWAQPHYARMAPDLREQVEAIDRHLYSRQGLGTWLGAVGALAGTVLGLHAIGASWLTAGLLALLGWGLLLAMGMNLWLQPDKISKAFGSVRRVVLMLILALSGALVGSLFGHALKRGHFDWADYQLLFANRLTSFIPGLAVGMLGAFLVLWSVARVRSGVLQGQRDRARLEAERDTAAAQARQAELRLLQAQIHPHFVFNTLAALQHWVDKGDARAGPLLRDLTGFLRGSTEMLGRPLVPLGEELASVRHYLAIMKARWGERLRYELTLDPALDAEPIPPGLLLTLVENAIEHGLAPCLDGGHLHVRSHRLASGWQLQVHDDGAGLPAAWQEGVGLANVRQRLAHHYGPRAQLQLQPATPGCLAELTVNP